MCRINPKKIRQPKTFPNVWIVNNTPDEIRPYRILLKTVLVSEFSQANQDIISAFSTPSKEYLNSIKSESQVFYYSTQVKNSNKANNKAIY